MSQGGKKSLWGAAIAGGVVGLVATGMSVAPNLVTRGQAVEIVKDNCLFRDYKGEIIFRLEDLKQSVDRLETELKKLTQKRSGE